LAIEIIVEGLCAGYGQVSVLREVSLRVADAETVVLLGTNGNGKSTLMKSLMGIVRPTSGRIEVTIDDQKLDLMRMTTEEIVDHGISLVPEGRHLFRREPRRSARSSRCSSSSPGSRSGAISSRAV
jgi:branched-chain amino acid transport system ATP-binding protein